jgi:site-specific DNA-methyltransferase (adenine-specific)
MGDLPRVELFAREKTEGWDVFGNEVEGSIKIE